jgi:hypothetical protein
MELKAEPELTSPANPTKECKMAEGSGGGFGVLGVLVGALIVIVVGGGLLFATGNLGGGKTTTLKVEMPKVGK